MYVIVLLLLMGVVWAARYEAQQLVHERDQQLDSLQQHYHTQIDSLQLRLNFMESYLEATDTLYIPFEELDNEEN